MKKLLTVAALLLGLSAPAFGQASYVVKDGNGAIQTIKSFNCSSQICPGSVPMDQTGAAFGVNANPFFMNFASGALLPGFAAAPSVKLLDASGNPLASTGGSLNVNVTGGGSGGGAVFGPTAAGSAAANPPIVLGGTADGTATGLVRGATVLPASGTASAPNTSLVVQLNPNSPGLITLGTAGSPSTSVMSVQGVGGGTAIPVSGTFFQSTQPVSAASLPLPTGAATAANQPSLGAAGSPSSNVLTVQGIASGVPFLVNPGTQSNFGLYAQGLAGAGQLGQLMMGLVSTGNPTLTSGNSNALSIDPNGGLRVNVIAGGITGTVSNASSGVATSSTNLATVAYLFGFNGTTFDQLQVDGSKLLKVNCAAGCGGAGTVSNASSAVATSSTNVGSVSWNYGFNGTTWDQLQVDGSKNLKVLESNSAAILTALGTINTSINSPLPTQVPTVSIGGVGIIDAGGTNKATVKPSSTAVASTDTSLAVGINPNSNTVTPVAATTGGSTQFHLIAAASNNSTLISTGAHTYFGGQFSNNSGSIAYVKVYDKATAPTCGTDVPEKTWIIPASTSGAGNNVPMSIGGAVALGLGICVVAGIADTDNTSVAASTYSINVDYK